MFARECAALAQWDIAGAPAIEVMHKDHRTFKVTTAGAVFVLKDVTDGFDLERLTFTAHVLTHVAHCGLKVPAPILSQRAQIAVQVGGRTYILYEFIEAGANPAPSAALFQETGRALALLHRTLAAYPDEDVRRKTWREDIAGSVAGWFSALCDGLPDDQASRLRVLRLARQNAIETALCGLPEQLIHRDCHPGNLVVDGTRVIGFIDWEDLCVGPRLFDLAYYAAHCGKLAIGDHVSFQRWLAYLPHLLNGYLDHHTLTQKEVLGFPYMMMAYHLLLAHWHMKLGRTKNLALELRALTWIHTNFADLLTLW